MLERNEQGDCTNRRNTIQVEVTIYYGVIMTAVQHSRKKERVKQN